jgi:hypothetical protein
MSAAEHPRTGDEWRVEVELEGEGHGQSLGERLHSRKLDNQARKRLGGSVIVTRDGSKLFLYARHEQSAREAERVVRELLEADGLAAEVQLTRWHPVEEEWRPADEPLPETGADLQAEEERHEIAESREAVESGKYDWEVIVDLPNRAMTLDFARQLETEGLPVRRRWKYVLVGVPTEEDAISVGKRLEQEAPDGSTVGVRANPKDIPTPGFVFLQSLEPGAIRDLGI